MKSNLSLILIVVSLTATTCKLTAQSKGKWLAEGNIGNINYSNHKELVTTSVKYRSEHKQFSASVYPRIGYFISNSFVVGATLNFTFDYNKNRFYYNQGFLESEGTSKGSMLGIAPFLRYYFLGKNSKNKLYAQLGGGFNAILFQGSESTDYYDDGVVRGKNENNLTGTNAFGEILLGYNHFFTENLAFNTAIGYNFTQQNYSTTSHGTYGNSVYTSPETKYTYEQSGIAWNFGFTLVFPNRKKEKTEKEEVK